MTLIRHTSSRAKRNRRRNGAMVAEFAVCLPILLLFFFALWEYSRMEVVRQTVKAAAFEGARQGIVDGATKDEMEAAAQKWLDAFSIREAQVKPTLETTTSSMEIEVPLHKNSFAASIFSREAKVKVNIELYREAHNG